MTPPNPFDYLCWYDKRYTSYSYTDEEEPPKPRDGDGKFCMCDNCCTGRDLLAMEILRLQQIVRDLAYIGFDGQGPDMKWIEGLINNKDSTL